MKQIMWWTYGLSGKECRKIFHELTESVEDYKNITYIRRDNCGGYTYRYVEDNEEEERRFFEMRLHVLDAEEQSIEGLVGVI